MLPFIDVERHTTPVVNSMRTYFQCFRFGLMCLNYYKQNRIEAWLNPSMTQLAAIGNLFIL